MAIRLWIRSLLVKLCDQLGHDLLTPPMIAYQAAAQALAVVVADRSHDPFGLGFNCIEEECFEPLNGLKPFRGISQSLDMLGIAASLHQPLEHKVVLFEM